MKTKKKKAIMLSIGLSAFLLTATNLNAQNDGNRGLFGRGDNVEYCGNRDGGIGLGSAETEDPTSPLGSGILALVVASVGYAAMKRKEDKQ